MSRGLEVDFFFSRKFSLALLVLLILFSLLGTVVPQEHLYGGDEFRKWQHDYPTFYRAAIPLGLTRLYTSTGFIAVAVLLFLSLGLCTFRRVRTLLQGKGGYGQWGSVLFHFSAIVILAGAVTSLWTKFDGNILLTEGQSFSGNTGEYASIQRSPYFAFPAPDFTLTLQKFRPTYGAVPIYVSDVAIERNGSRIPEAVRDFHALSYGGYAFYQKGHGFSPSFLVRDRWGGVVFQSFVSFRSGIGPDGEVQYEDYFQIPGAGLEVRGRLYPDLVAAKDSITTKSVLPVNPGIDIRIKKNGEEVYQGILMRGQSIELDGFSLAFQDLRYWSEFRVVRDPGVPVIYLGFIIGALGLTMKLLSLHANPLEGDRRSETRHLSGELFCRE